MFSWYRNSARCYVYLSDAKHCDETDPSSRSWQSTFAKARWFTRGWTLKELIALPSVEFFCSNGRSLGDKSLQRQLHEITKIKITALQGKDLSNFGIEQRLSWATDRETKRAEDKAYSLLSI